MAKNEISRADRKRTADWWGDTGKSRYKVTGNPLFIWHAYREIRRLEQPVPKWILSYLDECAVGLEVLVIKPPEENAAREIAKAFALHRGRGQGSLFTQFKSAQKRLGLAQRVVAYLRGDEISESGAIKSESVAIENVAEDMDISTTTVREAWYENQPYLSTSKKLPRLAIADSPDGFVATKKVKIDIA